MESDSGEVSGSFGSVGNSGVYSMKQIILASASPRRKELLEQMGLTFEICPARGEEQITSEIPEEVVQDLARQKAEEVAAGLLGFGEAHRELVTPQDLMVIAADTVVACEGRILGKPSDVEDAATMLRLLSGRTHKVCTGVAVVLVDKERRTGETVFCETTEVEVCPLSEEDIECYIATGEPMDKAGAYGIQGRFAVHVRGIRGDYNNVVGFPISAFYQRMKEIGIELPRWAEE